MKHKFLEINTKYDGSQLSSLQNYLQHGLMGDSIVAWTGPCNVSFDHMVDGEDLLERSRICGDLMLHFIIEKFDINLYAAVSIQRLLASIVKDHLKLLATHPEWSHKLIRTGDDIFLDQKKLSISIATVSPVSCLIHFAVNVSNEGTPVATLSLKDLGVEPRRFAEQVMKAFCSELDSIHQATQKVRWVR